MIKHFNFANLDRSIQKHYIFGQPYLLFNDTHYLDYQFRRTQGEGKYRLRKSETFITPSTTTRLAHEKFYASVALKENSTYLYIDTYAFPKIFNGKRICYSLTPDTIKYEYFTIDNELDFKLQCSKLRKRPNFINTTLLSEQYAKSGKNLADIPVRLKKVIALEQLIHTDLKKMTNFSVVPMSTFQTNQTLSNWIYELQASLTVIL